MNLLIQNLSAQENILTALTEAYAQTAETRKEIEEQLKRREATITSLITSFDAYEDLLSKSSKGLEFYRKLESNVGKLLQRVKSTCKVQEEEREQILAQNKMTIESSSASNKAMHVPTTSATPKLKDYLASRAALKQSSVSLAYQNQNQHQHLPSGITGPIDSTLASKTAAMNLNANDPNTYVPPTSDVPYYPNVIFFYYYFQVQIVSMKIDCFILFCNCCRCALQRTTIQTQPSRIHSTLLTMSHNRRGIRRQSCLTMTRSTCNSKLRRQTRSVMLQVPLILLVIQFRLHTTGKPAYQRHNSTTTT